MTWKLPTAYRLRNFQNGDEAGYINLMRLAGFDNWGEDNLRAVIENAVPGGIYFIEHIESRDLVATAMGQAKPTKYFSAGAELGWVACDPAHSGQGLGRIVSAVVTKSLIKLAYHEIYLLTDDFRLPAIKTYLKLGYLPFCYTPDMPKRWDKVLEKLKLKKADYPGLSVKENEKL